MPVPIKKKLLAQAFDVLGLNRVLLALQRRCLYPYIRAVNYHSVDSVSAESFECQLQFYQKHFEPVAYNDLLALVQGRWNKKKPGLIISFDDGLRNNAEVAAPLLEQYGFVGWFFLPVGFLDQVDVEQRSYAQRHRICLPTEPSLEPRIAMSWTQVRDLAKRHVVGCHTYTHRRFESSVSAAELTRETWHAKTRLEERLDQKVPSFCWVGGEEASYSRSAALAILDAGFQVSFMTNSWPIRPGSNLLQLQRTNIESDWDNSVVRFQLSGCVDFLYAAKRRRVNRLTTCPEDRESALRRAAA